MNDKVFLGLGRRKRSVARVRLFAGEGNLVINNKKINEYFAGLEHLAKKIFEPFEVVKTNSKYDVFVNVVGGGINGQACAISHGISRALSKIQESNKVLLRQCGLLTRDSREVERKKPGKPKARKSFQYSKR